MNRLIDIKIGTRFRNYWFSAERINIAFTEIIIFFNAWRSNCIGILYWINLKPILVFLFRFHFYLRSVYIYFFLNFNLVRILIDIFGNLNFVLLLAKISQIFNSIFVDFHLSSFKVFVANKPDNNYQH